MIKEFILPDIGEGVVECELMEWRVQEGETISEDQVIAEVMTDKAVVEIPAPYDGVIAKLHYNKGDIAQVHQPLFAVEVAGSDSSEPTSAPAAAPQVVEYEINGSSHLQQK